MGKVFANGSLTGRASRLTTAAATISMSLLLGACSQNGPLNLSLNSAEPRTADIATSSAVNPSQAELEKATVYWGEQHTKNPRDAKAAVSYARNLKAMGRKANALAVLQSTYMFAPNDKELLSEYGRLALDLGQVSTAEKLLIHAEDPAKPDWRIISARGTVLAKQGRFKEAIAFYERALSLSPGRPSLLNNLAMGYAMDGQAARAEELLRKAKDSGASDPRVQKNLDLVMNLQGKQAGEAPATAVAAAPVPTPAVPASTPAQKTAWNSPLPIERGAATVKVASRNAEPASMDADDIVRRAMAAEHAKGAGR